ncbi:MAG: T9SS type A sorting domain-containing protein [Bacteroidia bacterium]|nr:T9SS type A sorting domain-containing protein [Bacteroidia bacterium]
MLFSIRSLKHLVVLGIGTVLFLSELYGQSLPVNRQVNWAQGVSTNVFSYPTQTIDFVASGGINTGLVANDSVMTAVLSSISASGAIIYFPAGEYLFNSRIILLKKNIVLSGESPNTTTLKFNLGGSNNLIEVKGSQATTTSNFTATALKGDTTIKLANASGLQIGNTLKISDNDSSKVTSNWAIGATGQIVTIKTIQGNIITTSNPLRRDYLLTKNPKVTLLNPIKNVGIEKLTIRRLDSTSTQTSAINMNFAVNCWVSCIKSFNGNYGHISINNSSNCSVVGSYFQDAFAYGGNGQGYGVVIQATSGECLVFNNIFKHLRHSILFQSGSNGNVVSYNYSIDPYWTESFFPNNSAGDIVFHGNYPYCNLIEGNIVQNIVIDNSHGINGPFNTFHRNRAELYGVVMNPTAGDSTNFISNEVTNTTAPYGMFTLTGNGNFQYGNNVKGTLYPAGSTNPTTNSFYLNDTLPYYVNHSTWPPIGTLTIYNSFDNESKARFNVSNLTQCWDILTHSTTENADNNQYSIFPNPVSDKLTINGLKPNDLVTITNSVGNVLYQHTANINSENTFITNHFPAGIYFCFIQSNSRKFVIKFLKLN